MFGEGLGPCLEVEVECLEGVLKGVKDNVRSKQYIKT